MTTVALRSLGEDNTGDRAISSDGVIRLALNHPPPVPDVFNSIVQTAIEKVLSKTPPAQLMATHRWMGTENDRAQGAKITGRRLGQLPQPDRVIVAHSTQAAVQMLLPALIPRGRAIAVEQMSYPPVRIFAERYNIPVVDVRIDGDGLDPNALIEVCQRDNPAALYLLSTFQNPTTVTMSLERRQEIAAIARRYQVQIIEDDIYSLLASSPRPPISALVPELSWYLLGTAKSFSAGLKLSFVVAPSSEAAARVFWPGVRATYWMASPVSASLMAELITSGGDLQILAAVKAEVGARFSLVDHLLQEWRPVGDPGCLHLWIPLMPGVSSTAIAAEILARGVQVAPSASYARPNWTPPQAIRIGIGNPEHRSSLIQAMQPIAEVLADQSAYTS
jgi:DNA-binding transcriptional MocR family regulator